MSTPNAPDSEREATIQAVLHLGIGVSAAALGVLLVGRGDESLPNRLFLAGLSGATTSVLSPLFTGVVTSAAPAERRIVGGISPFLYGALGFGSAFAAVLMVIALLTSPSQALPAAGTAVFGGAIGIAATSAVQRWRFGPSSAAYEVAETHASPIFDAFGYVDRQVQDRLGRRTLIDYDGVVAAGWFPTSRDRLVGRDATGLETLGTIRVVLISRAGAVRDPGGVEHLLKGDSVEGMHASTVEQARVRVSAGAISTEPAPFTLEVHSSRAAVIPARHAVAAPQDGSTEVVEFKVVRMPTSLDQPDGGGQSSRAPATEEPRAEAFIIDVLQGTSTVQLLELDTAFKSTRGEVLVSGPRS